ncbi:hypothetical protein CHARACLAT_025891, partial [Characodon lateralis]|nr:hypothetical protein [Characodon lateralis]
EEGLSDGLKLLHISPGCSAFSRLYSFPLIGLPVISPALPQCMCTHWFPLLSTGSFPLTSCLCCSVFPALTGFHLICLFVQDLFL